MDHPRCQHPVTAQRHIHEPETVLLTADVRTARLDRQGLPVEARTTRNHDPADVLTHPRIQPRNRHRQRISTRTGPNLYEWTRPRAALSVQVVDRMPAATTSYIPPRPVALLIV